MKYHPVLRRCKNCKELFEPNREEDVYCPECDPRLMAPKDERREE